MARTSRGSKAHTNFVRNRSHSRACMRLAPHSQSCQARSLQWISLAASIWLSPAASLAARISTARGPPNRPSDLSFARIRIASPRPECSGRYFSVFFIFAPDRGVGCSILLGVANVAGCKRPPGRVTQDGRDRPPRWGFDFPRWRQGRAEVSRKSGDFGGFGLT